jgi:hypothetical protein
MDRAAAILAILFVAPIAVTLMVALLRGYTVHVTFDRSKIGKHESDD